MVVKKDNDSDSAGLPTPASERVCGGAPDDAAPTAVAACDACDPNDAVPLAAVACDTCDPHDAVPTAAVACDTIDPDDAVSTAADDASGCDPHDVAPTAAPGCPNGGPWMPLQSTAYDWPDEVLENLGCFRCVAVSSIEDDPWLWLLCGQVLNGKCQLLEHLFTKKHLKHAKEKRMPKIQLGCMD